VGAESGARSGDIFKEVQRRRNDFSDRSVAGVFLRLIEWTTATCRAGSFSIQRYHIGEPINTGCKQAAYTLSNGFAYAEMLSARGVPSISSRHDSRSFSIAGSTSNTSRWRGFREKSGRSECVTSLRERARQMFKLHTQTAGARSSLPSSKNNLTRTAAELMLAYMNATNSCHSNSADEPFTTPSEEWIRLAAHGRRSFWKNLESLSTPMNM